MKVPCPGLGPAIGTGYPASAEETIADSLPSVLDYLDYRRFLADWFESKKAANPRYSHRAFVARTGQRSPSLLSDVLAGRRNLTTAGLEGFLRALQLPEPDARFFRLLVRLDQAETPAEKNAVWFDIRASKRFRGAWRIEGERFRYLSTWYIPVIRELANRADFRDDPEWIAAQLRPPIMAEQAAEAMELLLELELLVREGGRIVQGGGSLATPRQIAGLAVHNYHHGMLQRAQAAIGAVDPDQRYFLAVTVTVPAGRLQQLRDELNAVQERILEICADSASPEDPVMQFNLHFFPLSAGGEG